MPAYFRSAERRRRASAYCLRAAAALLAATSGASSLAAQTPPAVINYAAADVIPAYDSFTVNSKAVGETRKVNVWVPRAYRESPTMKFPVLYMPDGGADEDFPHVVNTLDSLIALKQVRPMIVVGIPNTERRRDMTGPTRIASDSAIAKRVGGSAAFRAFIRDELIPAVNARYRTTDERSIVGESLAGLFVVETLLLEPSLFTNYIAFDPSLWWNKQALTESVPGQLKTFAGTVRTLYVGSSGEDIDGSRHIFEKRMQGFRQPSLNWEFMTRTDQTHATIFRAEAPGAFRSVLK